MSLQRSLAVRTTEIWRRVDDQQAIQRRLFKKYHGMITGPPSITLFTGGGMYATVCLGGGGVRPVIVNTSTERVRWEGLCQMINDAIIAQAEYLEI